MMEALLVHCECKVLSYEGNCDAFKSCVLNNAAQFAIRDSVCKMPRISCDDDLEPRAIEGEIEPLMSGKIWFNVWVENPVKAFQALDQIIKFAVHFRFDSDFRISGKILP